jgi:thymidylate synthase
MKTYLNIVKNVLKDGVAKTNRTGIKALTLPNQHFSHSMIKGFPLLTTKKMSLKTIATELEGFIKGITSKQWYKDRGCNIWNEWCNPVKILDKIVDHYPPLRPTNEEKKRWQSEEDDLGPIYGYQWRNFARCYDVDDGGPLEGYDQLKELITKLKENPNDRRLIVSAWNPHQLNRMALPPCHYTFCCTHIEGTLSLHWTQRSCDLMLGVPFNIASYGLLLLLLCKETNMIPYNLSGMLCDCHIYENQIDVAKEQLKRTPKNLPNVDIILSENSILNWNANGGFLLTNYNAYPKLDFGPVAV